jgi:hypothetical protein
VPEKSTIAVERHDHRYYRLLAGSTPHLTLLTCTR